MKKLLPAWLCYSALGCILGTFRPAHAVDFVCFDVTCLAAAINESNQTAEDDRIFLEAETFTLQTPLPFIRREGGRLEIIGSLTGLASTVQRDSQGGTLFYFRCTINPGCNPRQC